MTLEGFCDREVYMKERLHCPKCGSRRLMRIQFGLMMCPWSLKKNSRGRSWLKKSDARFIIDRTRNGGCCIDFQRSFVCARCGSELGIDWDLISVVGTRMRLRVNWTPDEDDDP